MVHKRIDPSYFFLDHIRNFNSVQMKDVLLVNKIIIRMERTKR
jgi:hypothetical protein